MLRCIGSSSRDDESSTTMTKEYE